MSDAEIRAEARALLSRLVPDWRATYGVTATEPPYPLDALRAWQRALADEGWGAPMWPVEFGGRGFGPVEAAIWSQEKARAGAPAAFNIVGFGMAGPTIVIHGSEPQKQRFLAPLLRGEEIWCQLFSEPGAGSDLASLAARAERDGDAWIVNGQKVWSSDADIADFGILLARTDPSQPKHRGLTYFIVDMRAPGVEVRPLRQINGEAHFSEVFFTEVRIPDGQRVSEVNDGWTVARTTLLHERMSLGDVSAGITYPFAKLAEIARGDSSATTRDDLVDIYARERLLGLMNDRIIAKLRAGRIPTSEGSVLKLMLADLGTRAAVLGLRLLGPAGTLSAREGPQQAFLWERAMHIGGGTDEVQRNQIAESVLGLPRDDHPDRGKPWSETRAR